MGTLTAELPHLGGWLGRVGQSSWLLRLSGTRTGSVAVRGVGHTVRRSDGTSLPAAT